MSANVLVPFGLGMFLLGVGVARALDSAQRRWLAAMNRRVIGENRELRRAYGEMLAGGRGRERAR